MKRSKQAPVRTAKPATSSPTRARWFSVVGVALVIIFVAIAAIMTRGSRVDTTRNPQLTVVNGGKAEFEKVLAEQPENTVVYVKLTEQQAQEAFSQVIQPAIDYVCTEYPIESLRNEFTAVASQIGSGREIEYHACGDIRTGVYASTVWIPDENGVPKQSLVVFWVPTWLSLISKQSVARTSFEVAKNKFEDLLVLAVLHEYFHAHNQDYWRKGSKLTTDELVESEAECWAYTIDKIVLPQLAAGRGPSPRDGAYKLMQAYRAAGSDRNDPRWKNTIREMVVSNQLEQAEVHSALNSPN